MGLKSILIFLVLFFVSCPKNTPEGGTFSGSKFHSHELTYLTYHISNATESTLSMRVHIFGQSITNEWTNTKKFWSTKFILEPGHSRRVLIYPYLQDTQDGDSFISLYHFDGDSNEYCIAGFRDEEYSYGSNSTYGFGGYCTYDYYRALNAKHTYFYSAHTNFYVFRSNISSITLNVTITNTNAKAFSFYYSDIVYYRHFWFNEWGGKDLHLYPELKSPPLILEP